VTSKKSATVRIEAEVCSWIAIGAVCQTEFANAAPTCRVRFDVATT
jgi:hypothetical protein